MTSNEENTHLLSHEIEEDLEPVINSDLRTKMKYFLGAFLGLLSSLTFACNNYAIKTWAVDFVDVLLVRSCIQIVTFGILAKSFHQQFWPRRHSETSRRFYIQCFLLLFQGCCAGLTMICVFLAVNNIPLGDALTLVYSAPLFTMILSAFFLGHRLRLFKLSLAFILITGVILVVQPPIFFPRKKDLFESKSMVDNVSEDYLLGTFAGIFGAIFSSILAVSIRYLEDFSHNVLVFYAGVGGLVDCLIIFNFDAQSDFFYNLQDISLPKVFGVALVGIAANLMSVKCYQLIPPAIASVIRSQEIVFAFILQSFVMGLYPNSCSIMGSLLVVASAILLPFESIFLAKIPNEKVKRFF